MSKITALARDMCMGAVTGLLIDCATQKYFERNLVDRLSLIACTDPCVYQEDGYCSLSRAASPGQMGNCGCVNFVPRLQSVTGPSQQSGQSLPDIVHPD